MERVTVNADALYQVLAAITGPSHLIRELIVIHDLHRKIPGMDGNDYIGTLINEFNQAVKEHKPTKKED